MQIKGRDSEGNDYVAIQLGYDTQNNPSLIICDNTGAVMLDAQGLHENIIPTGLIRNDMIHDGEISKEKFSFNVVETDKDGAIHVTDVYVNSDETEVKYVKIGDAISGVSSRVKGVEDSIEQKVWKSTIINVQNDKGEIVEKTIEDILVQNTIDINGISSRVQSIETNTEVGKLTQLERRVGQLEINEKNFKTEVSKTYLQTTDVGARNLLRNSKTLIYKDYELYKLS